MALYIRKNISFSLLLSVSKRKICCILIFFGHNSSWKSRLLSVQTDWMIKKNLVNFFDHFPELFNSTENFDSNIDKRCTKEKKKHKLPKISQNNFKCTCASHCTLYINTVVLIILFIISGWLEVNSIERVCFYGPGRPVGPALCHIPPGLSSSSSFTETPTC